MIRIKSQYKLRPFYAKQYTKRGFKILCQYKIFEAREYYTNSTFATYWSKTERACVGT